MSLVWTPIHHTHLSDQVYQEVRKRILSRAIQIDKAVNVEEIASELGVSRTPVVDAVKRLAAEGLVEIKARRGTYVKGISEQDLIEMYEVRELLELHAARKIIHSEHYAQTISSMEDSLAIMQKETADDGFENHAEFTDADKNFHTAMIDACNNQRIKTAYENLNIYMHIMRGHLYDNLQPPAVIHLDHTRILDALKQKNLALIEASIQSHLLTNKDKMLDNIRNNGGYL